jgi:hypothetical protein
MFDDLAGKPTGERIQSLRERKGLTRPVLAGLVGMSASWLKGIEQGRRLFPRLPALVIAVLAGIDMDIGGATSVPVGSFARVPHDAVARDSRRRLPAGSHFYWTMFGASNVALHAVSVSADLSRSQEARNRAEQIDPADIPSRERRPGPTISARTTRRRCTGWRRPTRHPLTRSATRPPPGRWRQRRSTTAAPSSAARPACSPSGSDCRCSQIRTPRPSPNRHASRLAARTALLTLSRIAWR